VKNAPIKSFSKITVDILERLTAFGSATHVLASFKVKKFLRKHFFRVEPRSIEHV
jgi:hypothetical protein